MKHMSDLRYKIQIRNNLRINIVVITSILICLFTYGCYYDSDEYLYPKINNTCDTSNVTYSLSVAPILNAYCNTCHGSSNITGVTLNSYTGVSAQVTNGHLLSSVVQDGSVPAMPQSGGKLDNCSISIIQKWIKGGALNN